MKKCIAILLAVALVVSGCSLFGGRKLRTDLDAIVLHNNFISNLTSGKVVKSEYGSNSWFQRLSGTREVIRFSRNDLAQRVMRFQEGYPIIPWMFDSLGYFDGTHFFYNYGGQWFVDQHDRFDHKLQPDYLGIPADLFENYKVQANEVYETFSGYDIYIQLFDGTSNYIEIDGTLNQDQLFKNIRISYYNYAVDAQGNPYYRTEYTDISYSSVNQPVAVEKPRDLSEEDIQYLTGKYDDHRSGASGA